MCGLHSTTSAMLIAVGLISAKTAFAAYIALAGLAVLSLDGQSRLVALVVLAVFAVRTYVDILRRRIAEREAAEAVAASPSPVPTGDVSAGRES